jgi:hypothetical protein
MDVPRMFALIDETSGPFDAVVGYGLVLPDGSAVSVSWPAGKGSAFSATSTAEECAMLRGADLVWIGEES